jgi:hypothetical protein
MNDSFFVELLTLVLRRHKHLFSNVSIGQEKWKSVSNMDPSMHCWWFASLEVEYTNEKFLLGLMYSKILFNLKGLQTNVMKIKTWLYKLTFLFHHMGVDVEELHQHYFMWFPLVF